MKRHEDKTVTLLITIIGILLCGMNIGWSKACIKVDEKTDSLSKSERQAVLGLLSIAFEKVNMTVSQSNCRNQYIVSNIRLGRSITTSLRGPGKKGIRTLQVASIEELGSAYEQMVHSLIKGSKLGDTAGNGVSRHNVTINQAMPNRIESDSLFYIGIGPGYIIGADADEVPISFNLGYRYELDSFGLDLNFQAVAAVNDNGSGTSSLLNLSGIYFFNATANHSPYIGGGLGIGAIDINTSGHYYNGGGLHMKAQIGYEFFRASTLRLLTQLDVTIPFYDLEHSYDTIQDSTKQDVNDSTLYAPVIGLTLGIGWGKNRRTITVRNR